MSYTIRRMREEDIPQVVEIEKIAFSRPWTKSIFKAALLLPYAAYYVAVEDVEDSADSAGPAAPDARDSVAPDARDSVAADPEKAGETENPEKAENPGDPGKAENPENIQKPEKAQCPEKVVGMCGVKKIFEEGDISNVAVHPDHRGRGISRKMLNVLMREARADGVQAFTLEVRAGNGIAVNLYESLGFRTEGVRPRFYDDPVEDGLIMWQRPEDDPISAGRK